ncbi:hypothetical protein KKC08_00690 [Patescibacteria group bacterium]|nr:hypothetical protein [Patescibacteria group bacterium]MCG2701835.1 hypothetical protein [Candidatus Parcubacteria bacterium]MBU4265242.1 hypothetical protein [Patescibacteria group bacterium]MBU4390281.1 hypothetical protein [Patescibacteria group bacterium]MBU4396672.1 hypothetical protein [Patescibacteria group bacterium]
MRNNIDRLKQLLKKTKAYKEKFFANRDFFNSKEAGEYREDLAKRYEELKTLIVKANGGQVPSVSMFGHNNIDVFENVYSEYNSTTAFHLLKLAPQYLIKAVAYHGGKKVNTPENDVANSKKRGYVKGEVVGLFLKKQDPFNYKKLLSLLNELNVSYRNNYPYTTSALIRAILDHIPPLLGQVNFNGVVNNHRWGTTDKSYLRKLLSFKDIADDGLHRQIGTSNDLIEMDCIPEPICLNRLLQECAEKGGSVKELRQYQAFKSEGQKTKTKQKIQFSLVNNEIFWDNYAAYNGSSFTSVLLVDNYENNRPDFITSIAIEAKDTDGIWKTSHFLFEGLKLDQELKVDANDRGNYQFYVSDTESEGIRYPRKMPDLDRDTLKLVIKTRSGVVESIDIKPGWIKG